MKIVLVTSYGNKKQYKPFPTWKLYKSSRIKTVYRRKGKYDMCILCSIWFTPCRKSNRTIKPKDGFSKASGIKR